MVNSSNSALLPRETARHYSIYLLFEHFDSRLIIRLNNGNAKDV